MALTTISTWKSCVWPVSTCAPRRCAPPTCGAPPRWAVRPVQVTPRPRVIKPTMSSPMTGLQQWAKTDEHGAVAPLDGDTVGGDGLRLLRGLGCPGRARARGLRGVGGEALRGALLGLRWAVPAARAQIAHLLVMYTGRRLVVADGGKEVLHRGKAQVGVPPCPGRTVASRCPGWCSP